MLEIVLIGRLPLRVGRELLQRACQTTIRLAKKHVKGSVTVTFVSDTKMRSLNKQYRNQDRATDVLSFSEPEVPGIRQSWGDIFVSVSYVRGEAARRGIPIEEEIVRVVIHGMLHLLGYDHATDETEIEMFTLQEKVLAKTLLV
ncbi:rRNA maturation RNase YbeY [Candidatus Uhrbacteria bacterium]|nr:rRNA maturation RNase YbeY [Candidatus Uhrbacteria bacterium]